MQPISPFWLAQARQANGPILELACGTGRLAIALAQAGHTVVGLDAAEPMLAEARRKAIAAGVPVEWVLGDMTDFDLARRFALIILAGNSLCHLLDRRAVEACLAGVRRHLTANGRFIIDVFVPDPRQLIDYPTERQPFGQYEDPDGRGLVTVTHTAVYEADTQIKRIRTYHQVGEQDDEIEGQLDLRMYFPQELEALLLYNGIAIDRRLASYDETPFGPQATQHLIIGRLA